VRWHLCYRRAMPLANTCGVFLTKKKTYHATCYNSLNPKCELSADFPRRMPREITKKTGAGKTTYPEGGRGASDCLALCAPGFFNLSGGAGECTACEKGKYNQTAGATVCRTCPLGYSTLAAGASSCSAVCQRGSFGAAGLQVIPLTEPVLIALTRPLLMALTKPHSHGTGGLEVTDSAQQINKISTAFLIHV
jgi:hypothetical protein